VEKSITRRGTDEISVRRKALDATFTQIEKAFGKDAIMRLGQQPSRDHEALSTGSLLIDNAIGIGGFPRGRVTEIYGPEASGKTTLALQVIATAQQQGLTAVFIDAEHALDTTYARKLGINVDDHIISQPDYGEQALEICEMLIRSGAVDVIVIDSVAALVPKAEVDGEMGDTHIGLQARLMSQALRKLTPIVHRSKTALIFINQVRQNINAMAFANKEVTPGGNALKFYASLRIDVRKIQAIKDKAGVHLGNKVLVKIAKNKMAPPFKKVEVDLLFGEGISREMEVFNVAVAHDIIHQSGAWFSFSGEKLGQGKEQVLHIFKERPELYNHILSLVKSLMELPQSPTATGILAGKEKEQVRGEWASNNNEGADLLGVEHE
jgi:recombination protein RecA